MEFSWDTIDFRVFQVTVSVRSAEGALLEKRGALMGWNGTGWADVPAGENKALKGAKLTVVLFIPLQ